MYMRFVHTINYMSFTCYYIEFYLNFLGNFSSSYEDHFDDLLFYKVIKMSQLCNEKNEGGSIVLKEQQCNLRRGEGIFSFLAESESHSQGYIEIFFFLIFHTM